MEIEKLGLSQFIKNHPVINENISYKIKYLNVLEYFVHQFSKDNLLSTEMLSLYMKSFGVDEQYLYYNNEVKSLVNGVTGIRFKSFKLTTYRYTLLIDCFFINCFFDVDKAEKILDEVKSLFKSRYHKKIDIVYNALFNEFEILDLPMINNQLECWKKNKKFFEKKIKTFLITANMSAGKSMLLNAIMGKKVNRTKNDTCTSKIHYIFNKSIEDGFSYEWDGKLTLDAKKNDLMHDNEHNESSNISVGTYFRSMILNKSRLCFIDTPGVNSSMDKNHQDLTKFTIESARYDCLIYILNAENIGTYDDRVHLEYIFEKVKSVKIIFVVNKLDRYKEGEDSIEETMAKVEKELLDIGFKNPIVCPISAYAGLLSKKILFGEPVDEEEQDELELFIRKFNRDEYDLSKYYADSNELGRNNLIEETLFENKKKYLKLLNNSGLIELEKLMTD